MSLLIKDDELLKNYNKFGKRLKNLLTKNLIVNQFKMKNI